MEFFLRFSPCEVFAFEQFSQSVVRILFLCDVGERLNAPDACDKRVKQRLQLTKSYHSASELSQANKKRMTAPLLFVEVFGIRLEAKICDQVL